MGLRTDLIPLFPQGSGYMEAVRSRIHHKMRDYAEYRFSAQQSCAINIFFDLAQEFDDLEQIHMLAVLILHMFFHYEAELYLKDEQGAAILVTPAINPEIVGIPEMRSETWNDSSRCYVPVRRREALMFSKKRKNTGQDDLLGVLVLYVNKLFAGHDLLFLQKFANRVGFCLHNKMLAQRNARHVLFLRKLAHDIGHNIVTPNMRLKLMLNQLSGQVNFLKDLCEGTPDEARMHDLRVLQRAMDEQLKGIGGAFRNEALFLESLLRQSHFDLGHYVLRLATLDVRTLVVQPQFERYRPNFEERALFVEEGQPECPPEPCMVEADLGLISQVLANLLSNAAKYAAQGEDGSPGAVGCRVERVADAFGEGRNGVRVTVFSSGEHIPPEEAAQLFDDSFRASNASGQYGTGHGLFFVREIVVEHKGFSGYAPVAGGNEFYFTLPEAKLPG